ncbi:MAG: hypothetical protein Q4P17_04050 [Methanobacterium sp.]|nr:hypothetical protein [Methanobacterium sp.]
MEFEKILCAWSSEKLCIAIKDFEICTEEEYEDYEEGDQVTFDIVKKGSEYNISEIRESELFDGFEAILINTLNKDEI